MKGTGLLLAAQPVSTQSGTDTELSLTCLPEGRKSEKSQCIYNFEGHAFHWHFTWLCFHTLWMQKALESCPSNFVMVKVMFTKLSFSYEIFPAVDPETEEVSK